MLLPSTEALTEPEACLCVFPTPAPVLGLQACVAVWVLGYQIQALVIAEQRLLSIEPSLPIPKL